VDLLSDGVEKNSVSPLKTGKIQSIDSTGCNSRTSSIYEKAESEGILIRWAPPPYPFEVE